jgi:hypothetical protein
MPGEFPSAGLEGPVALATCARCHVSDGIFSVNSYGRRLAEPPGTLNPQLLPAGGLGSDERAATVAWKQQQFNWGLLRGLLEAQIPVPSAP